MGFSLIWQRYEFLYKQLKDRMKNTEPHVGRLTLNKNIKLISLYTRYHSKYKTQQEVK